MSIIFKQFGVLDNFPSKIIIDYSAITIREVIQHISSKEKRNICEDILDNNKLKNDLIILVNGKSIDYYKGLNTVVNDGDNVVLLVLTCGG